MPTRGNVDVTKIAVEIRTDLCKDMKEIIPWGLKRHLIEAVVRLIVDAVHAEGQTTLGAILAGEYRLTRHPTGAVQKLNKHSGERGSVG